MSSKPRNLKSGPTQESTLCVAAAAVSRSLLLFSAPTLLRLHREMIISLPSSPPRSTFLTALLLRSCGPSQLSGLRALVRHRKSNKHKLIGDIKRRGRPVCRAELAQDAPFVAAIGACVLNSLVFPVPSGGPDSDDDDGRGGAIDSTDARLAVMAIISFIPYFNWMGWVFAWLDSGRQRYLVYSLVYLAPYLRTNLSLSPEESWLPIASIVFCIFHVQLEASIRNGDLDNIQVLKEIQNLCLPLSRKKDSHFEKTQGLSKKVRNKESLGLPSVHESRDKLDEWGIPRKSVDKSQHDDNLNVDSRETESD